jgi:FKBP-type peptidyl-prolyl cis-trans isomerase
MAQNGKIQGVVSTASGLQYTIVKPGNSKAASPQPTDRVSVQYRGRLLDGTIFDSSDMHPMAATFSLNGGVIKGWREAMLLMKPGAEWRVFVPPDLAYGDNPPPRIPPGSLLVFDIQLVKIEPPIAMPPKQARPDPASRPATAPKAK